MTVNLKSKAVSIIALLVMVSAAIFVYARSRTNKSAFAMAQDFPRGALVYAQFKDLPGLIKQWDQSDLKQQYTESTNYKEFQHRHLALKLVERWEEFNSALGFPLDAVAISSAADSGAAIAIYDIGRLDLVFIAPMSEEKALATKFFTSRDQFEETETPDGTTYYRHEFDADRGRQKQTIAFAAIGGRLIVATNERLLLRAAANIKGKSNDRVSDEPAFKSLSGSLTPHFATVWVDQTKLNDDYYFKHYWLMQNVTDLRSIRAGIFDLELQDGQWTERRAFLTAANPNHKSSQLPASEFARLHSWIPQDVPFFKIQSVGNDQALIPGLIQTTLMDRTASRQPRSGNFWSPSSYGDSEFYPAGDESSYEWDRYAYPGPEYDSDIDDPHDARISRSDEPGENPLREESDKQFAQRLQQAMGPAHPLATAAATSPQTIAGPLFVEFRRVAIITLQSPANLNRTLLEQAIANEIQSRLTVAGPTINLTWVDHNENDQQWRFLEIPMLGVHFCYALRDRDLVLANSQDFLKSVLATRNPPATLNQSGSSFDSVTVIRLDQRKTAFDDVVRKLDADAIAARQNVRNQPQTSSEESNRSYGEFFSGNLASLLDVSSAVRQIQIKRSSSTSSLYEEIDFILK